MTRTALCQSSSTGSGSLKDSLLRKSNKVKSVAYVSRRWRVGYIAWVVGNATTTKTIEQNAHVRVACSKDY